MMTSNRYRREEPTLVLQILIKTLMKKLPRVIWMLKVSYVKLTKKYQTLQRRSETLNRDEEC